MWSCRNCGTIYGKDEKLGIHKPKECSHCNEKYSSVLPVPSFRYHEVGFHDEETMLGGHVDAILDLRGQEINGELIPEDADEADSHLIVDFKSIRAEAFRRLVAAKDSHFTQMQVYLYLSKVRFGKLLYENKNDQMFREFLIARDEAFIKQQVVAAKLLKRIVGNTNSEGKRTLPPRGHKKDNTKECVECPFRSHCWALKKGK
ncbi:MAG: PD-(D/E)XK nuclease family protein [Promethearchaeota archaeon]